VLTFFNDPHPPLVLVWGSGLPVFIADLLFQALILQGSRRLHRALTNEDTPAALRAV
jgi:hypothetical protein